MTDGYIRVKGARVNNLKNIDLDIPRNKFIVVTGLSGSGKSSLAFDTLYAEGQRRYVESLSAYARQFLGRMNKPECDYIKGLPPAIAIEQKVTSRNPRSTVGTSTEIYDYLRLLWARVGTPHCPKCGREIKQQTIDQIIDQVLTLPEAARIQVLAPVIRAKRASTPKSLRTPGNRATSGCGRTAPSTTCPRRSSWTRTKSTTLRLWWTGWSSGPISASG